VRTRAIFTTQHVPLASASEDTQDASTASTAGGDITVKKARARRAAPETTPVDTPDGEAPVKKARARRAAPKTTPVDTPDGEAPVKKARARKASVGGKEAVSLPEEARPPLPDLSAVCMVSDRHEAKRVVDLLLHYATQVGHSCCHSLTLSHCHTVTLHSW
jgi:hypothetical protein